MHRSPGPRLCARPSSCRLLLGVHRAPGSYRAKKLRRRLAAPSCTDRHAQTDLTKKDEHAERGRRVLDAALARSDPALTLSRPHGCGLRFARHGWHRCCSPAGTLATTGGVCDRHLFTASLALGAAGVLAGLCRTVGPLGAAKRLIRWRNNCRRRSVISGLARAGYAFTTGLLMVAEELPKPLEARSSGCSTTSRRTARCRTCCGRRRIPTRVWRPCSLQRRYFYFRWTCSCCFTEPHPTTDQHARDAARLCADQAHWNYDRISNAASRWPPRCQRSTSS